MTREEAIERLVDLRVQFQVSMFTREAIDMAIEALQAEPVRHGEWEDEIMDMFNNGEQFGSCFRCSECGYDTLSKYNYCPNCGADMRGAVQ